jgi:ankyrin repeat protein
VKTNLQRKILVIYGHNIDEEKSRIFWNRMKQDNTNIEINYIALEDFIHLGPQKIKQQKYSQIIITAHGVNIVDQSLSQKEEQRKNHLLKATNKNFVPTSKIVQQIIDEKYLTNPGSIVISSCFSGRFMVDLQRNAQLSRLLKINNITIVTGVGSKNPAISFRDDNLLLATQITSKSAEELGRYFQSNYPDTAIVSTSGGVVKFSAVKITKNLDESLHISRSKSYFNPDHGWKKERKQITIDKSLLSQNFKNITFINATLKSDLEEKHLLTTKLWIELGAEVNCSPNQGGWTALILSAQHNKINMFELLMQNGASVNQTNNSNDTALMLAAENGNTQILESLIRNWGADIHAVGRGNANALILAVEYGHINAAKLLIANGAHINAKDIENNTALMFAAKSGDTIIVNLLIHHGANLNEINDDDQTALRLAIEGGHLAATELLVKKGANIKIYDSLSNNLLHHAAISDDENLAIILLNYSSIEIDELNPFTQQSALSIAIDNNNTRISRLIFNKLPIEKQVSALTDEKLFTEHLQIADSLLRDLLINLSNKFKIDLTKETPKTWFIPSQSIVKMQPESILQSLNSLKSKLPQEHKSSSKLDVVMTKLISREISPNQKGGRS